jgi:hypothetical protein
MTSRSPGGTRGTSEVRLRGLRAHGRPVSAAHETPWAIRGQRWLAFLANHREVVVALDFFTVPTATFQLLYCLFVIEHGRRRILHFNTTAHPTRERVVRQLREAFLEAGPYRYLLLDHDSKFDDVWDGLPEGHGPRAETRRYSGPVAKRDCGTLTGKLSPRDPRLGHRTELKPSEAADSRLCKLPPPPGPDSRFAPQGHAESSTRGTSALADRGSYLECPGRGPSSSLRLALRLRNTRSCQLDSMYL